MTPCPSSLAAGLRGSTAWSASLRWGLSSGLAVQQQWGAAGGEVGRADELTAKRAAAEYWCSGRDTNGTLCQHVIARGTLHGATGLGKHYCACCVVTERPQDQFRPAGKAAA